MSLDPNQIAPLSPAGLIVPDGQYAAQVEGGIITGLTEIEPPVSPDAAYPLDTRTLHSTYGDHFTGSSLDAKWTRRGSYVSGDEQHQMGGGTWMQVDTPRAAGSYWSQTAPSGDFTVVCKIMVGSTGNVMAGPMVLDSSGNGVGATIYASSEAYYVGVVAAGVFNSTLNANVVTRAYVVGVSMQPVWLKLHKSGTNYRAAMSINGVLWMEWTATISKVMTVDRIAFGPFFGTPDAFAIDWFDVE